MINYSNPQKEINGLKALWDDAAPLAYWGFRAHGRGAVVVKVTEDDACAGDICFSFSYIPHYSTKKRLPEFLQGYDPETEVVFILQRPDDTLSVHVLAGLPSPIEAAMKVGDPHSTVIEEEIYQESLT
jgi:hypothetical protein